jgi:membrane-bound lytic murein transglycosylase D
MRRVAASLLLILTVSACHSTKPAPAIAVPLQRPSARVEALLPSADALMDLRAQLDPLLASAQDAAGTGDAEEFRDCEAAIAGSLARLDSTLVSSREGQDYLGAVLDDLGQLAEQLESEDEGEEPPPEPQPVSAEQIAQAEAAARRQHFDLPVVVNPEVTSLIAFYTGRYRERFTVALERASYYVSFIRGELRRAGLPEDLAYLPLVESAFNPRARSRARAQGLWQFVAGTARLYGLRCDRLVDERNDPFLATDAAVRHLSDLHGAFADWELALAAYNSGAGRVERAMHRTKGATSFWQLRRRLPRETRNYVPAFWAVLVAAKNPRAYGLPEFPDRPPCLARTPVAGALDLEVLAERSGMDIEQLADLNPALTHRMTPAQGTYQLAVPCGRESEIAGVLAAIPEAERIRTYLHVVARGDTPASIARRYGSTVEAILAANHIRDPRSLHIGQTLVVPRDGARIASAGKITAPTRGTRAAGAPATPLRYTVRRGDTLSSIARRFHTSTAELQRRNGLSDTTIHPGDVIVIAR